jgi:hypothetical protein
MADQPSKSLTDIEKEAAFSYREWPIYIVMRLKRLQAIQEKLRVDGNSPSALLRRDELLKAVYDNDEAARQAASGVEEDPVDYVAYEIDDPEPPGTTTKARAADSSKSGGGATAGESSDSDSDYLDDVDYDA